MTEEVRIAILVEEFTRCGLIKRCQEKGLPIKGTKEEMARLLVENQEVQAELDVSSAERYQDAVFGEVAPGQSATAIPKLEPVVETSSPYFFRDVEEGIEA